jgi:diguanylate cyclase (GGDEF)-like protein/PAS domain S-box-containing protein
MSQLADLVDCLADSAAPGTVPAGSAAAHESRLAEVRLGMATSLFTALRCKHGPTAAHALRVALGCSSWAVALGLPDAECDLIETAALLHDVGKIGVPDQVLLKPGKLTADEALLMDRQRGMGQAILRSCSATPELCEVIRQVPAWFDGSRPGELATGTAIPLAARMIAIVDAYDSMTTDHLYRRALSRERAVAELYRYAGSQFDAELVQQFCDRPESPSVQQQVARRWLRGLNPEAANASWRLQTAAVSGEGPVAGRAEALFVERLLEQMYDAVVFVDRSRKVIHWNPGAERLTGISSDGVGERHWAPSLLTMCDARGRELRDEECPVALAMESGSQSLERMDILGRQGRRVAVDVHVLPVVARDGTTHGAAVILHDASPEASLEQRCQNLQDRATKDPLTQLANRAEFDRAHEIFVAAHLEQRLPCALIICDIDHFKKINDVYGHQAGDDAIRTFAQLLRTSCRPGDLVARYGGEEFVMLCADCNNATATHRAELLRRAICELAQPALGSKNITVSFGVTEIQPGDTPETMLRRADRALLEAKQLGRNTVVQLGGGSEPEEEAGQRKNWFGARPAPGLILERWLSTNVPLNVAIEKLRGFVADHHAAIQSIEGETIVLKLEGEKSSFTRRTADRQVPFLIELHFAEQKSTGEAGSQGSGLARTKVHVAIRPWRDRDRRKANALERARLLMASIKSYLMASEEEAPPVDDAPRRRGLTQWFRKRD